MLPYDGRRFHLRLMRREGTNKADLCVGRAAAFNAASQWLNQVEATVESERIRV